MSQEVGRPARYQRSFGGLVGSMIVLVAVVVAYVLLRAANSDDPEFDREAVDYLQVAAQAQQAGRGVVYPASLPDGWVATGIEGGRVWGISLLTDDGRFVGLRQADEELDELLVRYVDEKAEEGDPIQVAGSVAKQWETWTDAGGDTAYAAQLGDQWVLVFGSASAAQLRTVVESLTDAPL